MAVEAERRRGRATRRPAPRRPSGRPTSPCPRRRAHARQPAADVEHLVRPRRVRALAPGRRLAHPLASVRARSSARAAPRWSRSAATRMDRQQRGVDRRLGLAADAVAAVACVPQVVHALGDRIDEGPVAGLGQAGAGRRGGAGGGRGDQPQRGRGHRGTDGQARRAGNEAATGDANRHGPTIGPAGCGEQPPKGGAAVPRVRSRHHDRRNFAARHP